MRKVISNTTPILSLLKIGKLELLHTLYGQVVVPEAVYREVMAGNDKEYFADLRDFAWLTVETIGSVTARQLLFDLDDGEAETIVLAQEQAADLVIIDEKSGRRYAEQLGLTLTGTVGVLLKAKERGLIDEVAPLLYELQKRQSWMSDSLIQTALELAGE
jgi:predicted nucleic acid-binding protein